MNTQPFNSRALITASDQLLLKDMRDPSFTIESSSRGYGVMRKNPFHFQSFQRLRLYAFSHLVRTHVQYTQTYTLSFHRRVSKPSSFLLSQYLLPLIRNLCALVRSTLQFGFLSLEFSGRQPRFSRINCLRVCTLFWLSVSRGWWHLAVLSCLWWGNVLQCSKSTECTISALPCNRG